MLVYTDRCETSVPEVTCIDNVYVKVNDIGDFIEGGDVCLIYIFKFSFTSLSRLFQLICDNQVGRKRENPEKKHLVHLQADLGLSHMWLERGSNPH